MRFPVKAKQGMSKQKGHSMPRSPKNYKLKLKKCFHKEFPKTLKFLFPKKKFDYFHKLWIIFCVYKRIKVFFVPDVTLLNATVNL